MEPLWLLVRIGVLFVSKMLDLVQVCHVHVDMLHFELLRILAKQTFMANGLAMFFLACISPDLL